MSHKLQLKEGALIISDAHYSSSRPELLGLIQDIESEKIITTQLILMGDIFDALFMQVPKTIEKNQKLIALLNTLSKKLELVYFEGNHDFNLKNIFPSAIVVPLYKQPYICIYKDKTVALAHGDFDIGFLYKVYTLLIRNPFILTILNVGDTLTNHFILKKLDQFLDKKEDCREFMGFESYIKQRSLKKYQCKYFIEGHYHQNKQFSLQKLNYINLAAFACNQRYFIVKSSEDKELVVEENRYVEI